MASFVASGLAVWAPNPGPERGLSYSLDSDGRSIAYGSGYTVVMRDVANPMVVKVLTGEHMKHVSSVAFTPDMKYLASGDKGGVLNFWDTSMGKHTKQIPNVIGGPLLDIAFDATSKRVAVCGDSKGNNCKAFMWESGSAQGELLSSKPVLTISIRPHSVAKLAHGGQDFKVKLYKGPPFKFEQSFEGHTNFVQCVRYSPDGELLATAGSDKLIHLLDGESGSLKALLPTEHTGSVYKVAWAEDGKTLLSCSGDKTVKLWDVAAGKCVSSVTMGKQVDDMQVSCVFAGSQAVSLSLSGDLHYLDMKSGKVTQTVQAHSGVPNNVAVDWISGSDQVMVGSSQGPVYAYSPVGKGTRFEGSDTTANDGLVINKKKLFSVGHDDTLRSADLSGGALAFGGASSSLPSTPLSLSAAAGDPGLCVTCTESAVLLVRDGRTVDAKEISAYTVTCAAIAEDGSEVAVGGNDKAAHIFKINNDRLEATTIKLDGLQGSVSAIAYSPEGPIAVGDNVKEITLWDRSSRECLIKNKWVFHTSKINSLCFSPSGKHLASAGSDGQVIIWNPEKKLRKTKIAPAHNLGAFTVAWIDDSTVVSGGGDGCVRKWSPELP